MRDSSKQMSQDVKEPILWVSMIRFLALFMVIMTHVADNVPQSERVGDLYKSWIPYYGSALRACVPLFVMLTGYLLLPKRLTAKEKCLPMTENDFSETLAFYKKRIPRVLIPFVFWTIVYSLIPWIMIGVLSYSAESVTLFFAWADPATLETSFIGSLFRTLKVLPFNFSIYTTHMWYIYVIIGIYLYFPVLSAWVEKSSLKSKYLFLAIATAASMIPYLRFLNPNTYPPSHYIMGACSWNEFGMLYYFAGFNGYLVLGHVLGCHKSLKWKVVLPVSLILFVAGYVVTVYGFSAMLNKPGVSEEEIELFYTYCTPNVAAMTVAVFLLIKKTGEYPFPFRIRQFFNAVNGPSFGVYLIHYLFLGPYYHLMQPWSVSTPIKLMSVAILTFITSWFIVGLVRKVKLGYIIFG